MQQLGASFGELNVLPSTPTEPLPPLPAEVDDACIYPNEIAPQPIGIVPVITGFNLNVRIYSSYSILSAAEMVVGIDELFDWDRQQKIIQQSLSRCRHVLDDIPDVLKVLPKDSQNGKFGQRRQPYYPPMPEYANVRDPTLSALNGPEPQEARRGAQYEIQKANIYATHLSIRSYLVEKYFALLDKWNAAQSQQALQSSALHSSPNALAAGFDRFLPNSNVDAKELETSMENEREQVVKDLLIVLGSIDMVNMEPNGDSFVSLPFFYHPYAHYIYAVDDYVQVACPASFFLRQDHLPLQVAFLPQIHPQAVFYPLLQRPSLFLAPHPTPDPFSFPMLPNHLFPYLRLLPLIQTQKIRQIASTLLEVPKERRGSVALQHQDYLYKFLDILSKLERVSPDLSDQNGQGNVAVDEESELRAWADLRDYQLKFQESGGIYGFS
jgi:hypothetical protein